MRLAVFLHAARISHHLLQLFKRFHRYLYIVPILVNIFQSEVFLPIIIVVVTVIRIIVFEHLLARAEQVLVINVAFINFADYLEHRAYEIPTGLLFLDCQGEGKLDPFAEKSSV